MKRERSFFRRVAAMARKELKHIGRDRVTLYFALAMPVILLARFLLSGFLTPLDAMPTWIRPISALNPVRYFVELCRSVILRRADLSDVAPLLVALVGLGTMILTVATLRFRRQIA